MLAVIKQILAIVEGLSIIEKIDGQLRRKRNARFIGKAVLITCQQQGQCRPRPRFALDRHSVTDHIRTNGESMVVLKMGSVETKT